MEVSTLALHIGSELPDWATLPRKAPERSTHWITQLKSTKLPRAHVCLDSEATIRRVAGRQEHRFACAASREIVLPPGGGAHLGDVVDWVDPEALWSHIDGQSTFHGELVVWAHNLPYDLRVCDGLKELARRGWELEAISLMRTAAWASWRRKGVKLLLTDSVSWWKCGLDKLGAELGSERQPFNYAKASEDALRQRCRDDVTLLARGVAELLGFLKTQDLGSLRPTGSGQSHAAWRRRFMPKYSVRVHDDAWALYCERQAMHTGRTECWRLGKAGVSLYEFDLNLAYCRIAASNALPTWLNSTAANVSNHQYGILRNDSCVLADVDVETDLPLVPTTREGRTIWPTGAFKTVLWDPEIDLLLARGQKVSINYTWLYRRGNALAPMSKWLLDQLGRPAGELSPVIRRLLKHWARTLVGRMALRYRQWDPDGTAEHPDLCISYEPDFDTGEVNRVMRVGHQTLLLAQMSESTSSCPMVPGWVQSRCRAIMWELVERAGAEHVWYMDTDGFLLDLEGARQFGNGAVLGPDWFLLMKGTHLGATIWGERNIELPGDRRLSGIPKGAEQRGELEWAGETWEGLERALEAGQTDLVRVSDATWRLKPQSYRRETLPGGRTRPWHIDERKGA